MKHGTFMVFYSVLCYLPQCQNLAYDNMTIVSIFMLGTHIYKLYLRNRKHVPCFYRVIQTQVEVWANEKC